MSQSGPLSGPNKGEVKGRHSVPVQFSVVRERAVVAATQKCIKGYREPLARIKETEVVVLGVEPVAMAIGRPFFSSRTRCSTSRNVGPSAVARSISSRFSSCCLGMSNVRIGGRWNVAPVCAPNPVPRGRP